MVFCELFSEDSMKEKNLYACHVFVCTNKKDGGKECCADKGAAKLRDELKAWAKEKYGKKVRINASGCLDFCAKGIATVIYPSGEWHFSLTSGDCEKLKMEIDSVMQEKTNS